MTPFLTRPFTNLLSETLVDSEFMVGSASVDRVTRVSAVVRLERGELLVSSLSPSLLGLRSISLWSPFEPDILLKPWSGNNSHHSLSLR